jgi:predicted kinase
MPVVYLMVGIPGSGKSTWIQEKIKETNNAVIVSTDGHIEKHAKSQNKAYNEVFHGYIKTATNKMVQDLNDALYKEKNIFYDQTNLGAKTRRWKLSQIPSSYKKIAVVFKVSDEILNETNEKRKEFGRALPDGAFAHMKDSFEDVSQDEGFDEIIVVERK